MLVGKPCNQCILDPRHAVQQKPVYLENDAIWGTTSHTQSTSKTFTTCRQGAKRAIAFGEGPHYASKEGPQCVSSCILLSWHKSKQYIPERIRALDEQSGKLPVPM
ncbi:hypothetical protein GOP47_0020316 [Adiantum capillus-veneris]|uniref:Uncharacterized protein n=1 Tax=Adiantum capillus-veneris TaxID=13818 RepID=A0A9D4ZAH8_ADICA|nr:hypothetical protein GOP47_0020316 [Adiantum capillus-veneris]